MSRHGEPFTSDLFGASLLEDCDASRNLAIAATDERSAAIAATPRNASCPFCGSPVTGRRKDAVFCKKQCRQAAWRLERRRTTDVADASAKRIAYADPPYPGMAKALYASEESFAGEVDHAKLIASLVDGYDGWALSTGAYALRSVLPLCPAGVRVCAWVKPIGVSSKTYGLHNTWEPIIVSPARSLRPGKRDWFSAQPARRGGTLIGRKPIAFCAFLFDALGMVAGDTLDDLFPGTGVVGRSWATLCRRRPIDTSPLAGNNASPGSGGDAS